MPPPAALPPAGSGPVIWLLEPCFPTQGNASTVEPETYLYYIKLPSPASRRRASGCPYDDAAEQIDAATTSSALWATNFLEDLSIEAQRLHLPQRRRRQVIVTYNMEERERVKIVDYQGSKQIDRTKIDEQLREREHRAAARFVPRRGRRSAASKTVLREMMAEKGFTNAEVDAQGHAGGRRPEAGERHLQRQRGAEDQDSRRRVRRQHGDQRRHAAAQDEGEQAEGHPLVHHRRRHLQGSEVRGRRRHRSSSTTSNEGYVQARVGQPELKVLEDTKDGKTRWIQLRIPVTEGPRYRVGEFASTATRWSRARRCGRSSRSRPGEWYSEKDVRDGLQEGAGDLRRRRLHGVHRRSRISSYSDDPTARGHAGGASARGAARAAGSRRRRQADADRRRHDADRGRASSTSSTASPSPATPRRATT